MSRIRHCCLLPAAMLLCIASSGCALWPDRIVEPQFHNPFPQIYRVAVLPFFNQSAGADGRWRCGGDGVLQRAADNSRL